MEVVVFCHVKRVIITTASDQGLALDHYCPDEVHAPYPFRPTSKNKILFAFL